MTEPTEPTGEAPEETPESGETTNNEAAKWRRKLRDTEAERDALTEQITALRTKAVEDIAAQHLDKPAALWAAGVNLNSMLNDDGTVSVSAVEECVREAKESLGLADRRKPMAANPAQGANASKAPVRADVTWQNVLRGH